MQQSLKILKIQLLSTYEITLPPKLRKIKITTGSWLFSNTQFQRDLLTCTKLAQIEIIIIPITKKDEKSNALNALEYEKLSKFFQKLFNLTKLSVFKLRKVYFNEQNDVFDIINEQLFH